MISRKTNPQAQTFVFFAVSFSTVFLLCGLGLDAGLWYLDRTRLARACDASAITGAANFGLTTGTNQAAGRSQVAKKMRDVAVANYYGLKGIATTPVQATTTNNLGGNNYHYYYTASGDTNEAGFHVTVATGLGGQVTLATAEAWAKTHTSFMGFTGYPALMQLSTKGVAEAKRRPRLIVVVLDRSGSMIDNGGATNLPKAVTNFLGLMKNDAENNEVGIVSFSSFGRVEMFPTTNFWTEGTNMMYKAEVSPGGSPSTTNPNGLKFSGGTGADEGMRLALELMRTNRGYTDPQTFKFIVFFTDGEFNVVRTLVTAPTWTNTVVMPASASTFTTSVAFRLPWTNNGFGPDMTYALGKGTNIGQPREYIQTNTPVSGKYPSKVSVVLFPGWTCYTTRAGGSRETNWSRHTNIIFTNTLAAGDSISVVAPGYILDGNFVYGSASGSVSTPNYVSKNGYRVYKASDAGEPLGNVYPAGIKFNYITTSGYTNLFQAGADPAGELFYVKYSSSTQEITTLDHWQRDIPDWATNYNVHAMTNYITPGGSMRYHAAAYTGFLKPSGWIEDSPLGGNLPYNKTPGAIYYSNSPFSQWTNINVMSINGGPTHYYDFRVAGWSNFKTWSDSKGTNMSTAMCNWKVMTYCSQARKRDILVYTVGFDGADSNILASMANDRGATNYNSSEPTGRFYDCNTPQDIVTNFTQIAQQILAFLSR